MRQKNSKLLILLLVSYWMSTAVLCETAGAQPISDSPVYVQPDNRPSEEQLSHRMLVQEDRFMRETASRIGRERDQYWNRDLTSVTAYETSVRENRMRFARMIGVVDERQPSRLERLGGGPLAIGDTYTVYRARWTVFEDVEGEGLLLVPIERARGAVVAVPDADQTPEEIAGLGGDENAWAARLAASGLEVIVPVVISRGSQFSGGDNVAPINPWEGGESVSVWTNMSHREWIYRQAFEMGRHVIGFEVQKIMAAVDAWEQTSDLPIAVAGYGEGGLLALYSAAVDPRIDAALVSGYFGPRDSLWSEPPSRNVWGLLREFGDAEIASLIAPRPLIIEYSKVPEYDGPATPEGDIRNAGSPGRLHTPSFQSVSEETNRARAFFDAGGAVHIDITLVHDNGSPINRGSEAALTGLATAMGVTLAASPSRARLEDEFPDVSARQGRQVGQIERHMEHRVVTADRVRYAFVQGDRSTPESWDKSMEPYRKYFWEEVLGRLPDPSIAPNPVMWKVFDEEKWTGYEVVLDVYPGVTTFGVLNVPKDLGEGEQRPVVVTQHGAGGLPRHTVRPEPDGSRGNAYNSFASELANLGYITFSPHNPSGDRLGFPYRRIERRANPVGLSIFSLILANNQQILRFLKSLDYVDPDRIAFYGLSWGGRTAMRVPALLKEYCLSITSGDFNEWIRKVTSVDFRNSYMFYYSFETYEWNLGYTFGHAEMAGLIAPRPFMVESGYLDNVAADSWVGYEYAKVHRLYDLLGVSDRTDLEFFNGRHEIHGKGTFNFLRRQLNWPRS